MTSVNLAICFAPSLLWPNSELDVIKNEVPPLIQFFIEKCPRIFGHVLPALYQQCQLPSSPLQNMDYSSQQEVQYIPTKIEDGTRHKRTDSMDTTTSEDSGPEDGVVLRRSNLRRAHNSGLTLSDSQLSQISQQVDDYDTVQLRVGRKGRMEMSGKRIHVGAGYWDPADIPVTKKIKKSRHVIRSNSCRGPNEEPPTLKKYRGSKVEPEVATSRRKSIAVQTTATLQRNTSEYTPKFDAIPASPNSSFSSSSQGYSPQIKARRPPSAKKGEDSHRYKQDELHIPVHRRHSKKRLAAHHSHSFSKGSENAPAKPIPTSASASFYDKLLPLETDTRNRSRSMGLPLVASNHLDEKDEETVGGDKRSSPPRQTTTKAHIMKHPSSQSITSSCRSGSSSGSQILVSAAHHSPQSQNPRPSIISLASSCSAESMTQASPDLLAELEQTPLMKLDRDFVKGAISKRFGISDIDFKGRSNSSSASGHSSYPADQHQHTVKLSAEGKGGAQRKRHDRSQHYSGGTAHPSDSSFSSSHSYQTFVSNQQKDSSLMNLSEEPGYDDLPESDRHFHDISRSHKSSEFNRPEKMGSVYTPRHPEVLQAGAVMDTVTVQDVNKLCPGSGYNSDTESSPSRTLSRPGKIMEVTSPTKTSIPQRYHKHASVHHSSQQPTHQHYNRYRSALSPGRDTSSKPAKLSQQHHSVTSTTSKITVESKSQASHQEKPPQTLVTPPSEEKKTEVTKASRQLQRPHSGDSSKGEREAEEEEDPQQRDRSASEIEQSKVKLGLIPRQRSKSTSENEAIKIISNSITETGQEQPEGTASTAAGGERAEKHKEWLSSAPTSAERRKAWEKLSSNVPKFQRADIRSRSLRGDNPPVVAAAVETPSVKPPSLTPEIQRKCATMPEYLTVGSRQNVGRGMIRTVKILSYDVPEPQRIRRINLRTQYS